MWKAAAKAAPLFRRPPIRADNHQGLLIKKRLLFLSSKAYSQNRHRRRSEIKSKGNIQTHLKPLKRPSENVQASFQTASIMLRPPQHQHHARQIVFPMVSTHAPDIRFHRNT